MKKIIAILLSLTLLVSIVGVLAGCQEKGTAEGGKLLVGYGRADVTPDDPVPLGGYNNDLQRVSTTVRDPIYATCIAVTAEDGTSILMYSVDIGRMTGTELAKARKVLSKELGLPVQNIIESCTHNHFGPSPTLSEDDHPALGPWNDKLEKGMVQAGRDAWNDRKEATLQYSSIEVTGLNAVRHYIMDDGSVDAGAGSGTGTTYVSQVKEADKQMQVVLFRREEGKDIVMVNFQAHPQEYYWEGLGGMDTTLTADTPGATRDFVEKQLDCNFVYFSGASGNLNTRSYIESENVHDNLQEYGEKLGRYVVLALEEMEELKVDAVRVLKKEIPYKEGKSAMQVDVFQLGELGFASVPYEMFDTSGQFIKENSPYKATFILYLANGSGTYIPAEYAYNFEGGYEVGAGYPKGAAEELANGYVSMLEELHAGVTGGQNNG